MSLSGFWMLLPGICLDLAFHIWAISKIFKKRPYSLRLTFQCCLLKPPTHPCDLYGAVGRRILKKHSWLVCGKKTVERSLPKFSAAALADQTPHPKVARGVLKGDLGL